jgi:hypothetical protein
MSDILARSRKAETSTYYEPPVLLVLQNVMVIRLTQGSIQGEHLLFSLNLDPTHLRRIRLMYMDLLTLFFRFLEDLSHFRKHGFPDTGQRQPINGARNGNEPRFIREQHCFVMPLRARASRASFNPKLNTRRRLVLKSKHTVGHSEREGMQHSPARRCVASAVNRRWGWCKGGPGPHPLYSPLK